MKDPRWRPDGKELYYIAPDSRLIAAPIAFSGTVLQPGLPTALFQPRIALGRTVVIGTRQQYDVAPDGRFLINVNADEGTAAPITVITNWNPEAKKWRRAAIEAGRSRWCGVSRRRIPYRQTAWPPRRHQAVGREGREPGGGV